MPLKAKSYIYFHLLVSICFFVVILQQGYSLDLFHLLPFIVFGCLFEALRLSAFTLNGQEMMVSAGSAVILASVVLFNPLELFIFSLFYGTSIVFFPIIKDPYKILFNICQTINTIFLCYLVWKMMDVDTDKLLSTENLVPLLTVMFTFVILDLLFVSIIVSLASGIKLKEIIKDSLDWVTVSYILIALIGLVLAVMYKEYYIYGLVGFAVPLFLMRYNMHLFHKEKEKQVNQLLEFNQILQSNNDQLLFTLSQIIDARDNSLLGHSANVAKYAVDIGTKLSLTDEELSDLKRGALLHDIGKLSVSESILQKPGRLTESEFSIVKKHTIVGEEIIGQVKGMERVAKIIGQHHEHYSGKGYPNQLKEEEILIEARIVTLCDSVDTMLSTRSYKNSWTLEDVIEEVVRCKGTHFDPVVVDAFLEVINEKEQNYFKDSTHITQKTGMLNQLLFGNPKVS